MDIRTMISRLLLGMAFGFVVGIVLMQAAGMGSNGTDYLTAQTVPPPAAGACADGAPPHMNDGCESCSGFDAEGNPGYDEFPNEGAACPCSGMTVKGTCDAGSCQCPTCDQLCKHTYTDGYSCTNKQPGKDCPRFCCTDFCTGPNDMKCIGSPKTCCDKTREHCSPAGDACIRNIVSSSSVSSRSVSSSSSASLCCNTSTNTCAIKQP